MGKLKTLIWTQPRPTSKSLFFRRPEASPTIADESIIILDFVSASSNKFLLNRCQIPWNHQDIETKAEIKE